MIHSNTENKSITLPFSQQSSGNHDYIYQCSVKSPFSQTVKIGIAVDDRLDSLMLNEESISLDYMQTLYAQEALDDWKRGYPFDLSLNKGLNTIQVTGNDKGGKFGFRMAQSLDYIEYILLFIFGIIPLLFGLYFLIFDLIFESDYKQIPYKFSWSHLPYFIIVLGIILRIYLLVSVPNTMYQHDFSGHVNAIKHYAEFPFEIPQADKSLQFPQQPLYYMSSAIVYSISTALGFSEYDAIYAVRSMSVFYAALWLVLSLALARLYLINNFSINIFMAFMAFTPSFIFLGAVVNNDALNAVLGIWALYEISAYVLNRYPKHFWRASLAVLLAALTKISSLLFAIYFVVMLLVMYYQYKDNKVILKRQILLFGLGVLFIFGFALLKSHVPANQEFLFVNSALYARQILPTFDLNYFMSFYWFDLIKEGQSYVFGSNTIRYSLPTYFYGTMLSGEFEIVRYFKAGEYFKIASQLLYVLGIIYVIGFLSYFYFFKRLTRIQKFLLLPVLINAILIIKFLSDYWVVCNSDFRYFTPVLAAIGLIFVLGLNALKNRYAWLMKPISIIAILLVVIEIYWMVKLIEKT
ncbi:MAG: hypothetical protein U9R50_10290 [Campylobacterota bacterium]|nr:hypothetical protein [Campylobacterota bacterium]